LSGYFSLLEGPSDKESLSIVMAVLFTLPLYWSRSAFWWKPPFFPSADTHCFCRAPYVPSFTLSLECFFFRQLNLCSSSESSTDSRAGCFPTSVELFYFFFFFSLFRMFLRLDCHRKNAPWLIPLSRWVIAPPLRKIFPLSRQIGVTVFFPPPSCEVFLPFVGAIWVMPQPFFHCVFWAVLF